MVEGGWLFLTSELSGGGANFHLFGGIAFGGIAFGGIAVVMKGWFALLTKSGSRLSDSRH